MLDTILKRISLDDQITTHFKWKEALVLRKWNMFVYPDDKQKYFIFQMALKLEEIRHIFNNREIIVTSWLRPKQYDNFIKSRPLDFDTQSRHLTGKAVDFQVWGYEDEVVQKILIDHIDELKIRLELGTTNWSHIDLDYKRGAANTFSQG